MFDDNNNQTDQTSGAPAVTPAYPTATPEPVAVAAEPAHQVPDSVNFPSTMAFSPPEEVSQPSPVISQPAFVDNNDVAMGDDSAALDSLASSSEVEAPQPEEVIHKIDNHSDVEPVAGADDLLNIKQQALEQLSPLIGKLEQTAEEKFRTTMMMIQASDDKSLIKEAYASAQAIEDEKAKAQALLDIINEINYFTQQHED